jgi:hypothetical protein
MKRINKKLQNHGKQKKTFTEEAKLTHCNTSPTKTSGATEAKVISAPLVLKQSLKLAAVTLFPLILKICNILTPLRSMKYL